MTTNAKVPPQRLTVATAEMMIRHAIDTAVAYGPNSEAAMDSRFAAMNLFTARADETVAALLPPGSMVVTEDRVVELASILVKRVAGDHVSGLARVGAVNALIADLRAGAQS